MVSGDGAGLLHGGGVVDGDAVERCGVSEQLPTLPVFFLAVFEQVIFVRVGGFVDEQLVVVLGVQDVATVSPNASFPRGRRSG